MKYVPLIFTTNDLMSQALCLAFKQGIHSQPVWALKKNGPSNKWVGLACFI